MNVGSYPPDAFDWLEELANVKKERQRLGERTADTGYAVELHGFEVVHGVGDF